MASGLLFNGIWRGKGGADDAIARMLEHCHEQIWTRPSSPFGKKSRKGGAVGGADGSSQNAHHFDHVILAVQANQVGSMLGEDESLARKCLSTVGYETQ